MIRCLLDIKEKTDNAKENDKQALEPKVIEFFDQRYETILEEGEKMYSANHNKESGRRGRKIRARTRIYWID
ncbi:MAG: hypothetical protein AB1422_04295 [bacterium]